MGQISMCNVKSVDHSDQAASSETVKLMHKCQKLQPLKGWLQKQVSFHKPHIKTHNSTAEVNMFTAWSRSKSSSSSFFEKSSIWGNWTWL